MISMVIIFFKIIFLHPIYLCFFLCFIMVHLTVLLITTRRGRHPGRGGHPSRRAGGTCAAGRARGGAGGGLPVAWQNSGRSVAGWETIWQSAQKNPTWQKST